MVTSARSHQWDDGIYGLPPRPAWGHHFDNHYGAMRQCPLCPPGACAQSPSWAPVGRIPLQHEEWLIGESIEQSELVPKLN